LPYRNPDDRALASKRYYWRRKHHDDGLDFDSKWNCNQLKENYHRIQVLKQITQSENESVSEKEGEKQVHEPLFAYDNPVVHEMPISPDNYSGGVDDFFLVQEIVEDKEKEAHWSGLTNEAVKRIEDGTAPLLFDREIDLLPVVAEFEDYLDELERAKREQSEGKKNWRFF